jgi:hypothetical protein
VRNAVARCAEQLQLMFWLLAATIVAATVANAETSAPTATGPPYLSVYIAILTGLLGFFGSWIGAHVALLNFKRQRAFDKQLDWYERAAGAIHSLADYIQVALTSEENKEPAKKLEADWKNVQSAHRVLDKIFVESRLYASESAIRDITKITRKVQKVANQTEAFDPTTFKPGTRGELLGEIDRLSNFLEDASPSLVEEGRIHLGIDRVSFLHRLKSLSKSVKSPGIH